MLDTRKLDARVSCFKLTMTNNAEWALEQPILENPLFDLWRKLSMNHVIDDCCSVYLKVGNIAGGMFLALLGMIGHSPMLHNRLTAHLDLCVRMFVISYTILKPSHSNKVLMI